MIKRIASYIGTYRKQAILGPIFIIMETVGELILPLLMASIIDDGIYQKDMGVIVRMGLLMALVAAVSTVVGVASARCTSYAAQGLGANLRRAEFEKISEFSFADIDRFSSSSLITRLTNDLTNVQNAVMVFLRMMVRAATFMIVALAVLFHIDSRLGTILLISLPVLAAVIGILVMVCHKFFEIMQKKIDALNETVQENLIAIRVVKAFVREDYERKKFQKANDEFTKAGLAAVLRVIFMNPIMMFAICIVHALVLHRGSGLVLGGEMELGELSSCITYIFNVLFSIIMLAMAMLQYVRATASAKRIFEVLDAQPDIQDAPGCESRRLPQPRGRVDFEDVSFRYTTGTGDDVLEHVSFTVQPGQVLAIVGGTGVGKSSLVNLIPRFYDVTDGRVLLDGTDVRDYPIHELRGRIGMVLQNNVLFSGTIRENLLWGREDATEEEIVRAAKDAQAYDFIMSFPDGFDTVIQQGGVNVSGGQKQRLCIARAMLRKPAVLILDDSTSAVDSATEALIRQSFRENLKGTTVILIAQRISSVRDADQIIVLDDGVIAGQGTHQELMAGNAIYQEIYWSQQEGVAE